MGSSPDDDDIPARIAAFQAQIGEMRRDLTETLQLVELLREQCLNVESKMAAAEQEQARLLKTLSDGQIETLPRDSARSLLPSGR